MKFRSIDKYDENIFDQTSFDESKYCGIDRLLKTNWADCLFLLSVDDEEVGEQYYTLESIAEIKETLDDIILVELDNVLFAIVNTDGEYAIAINSKDLKMAKELLTD